MGLLSFIKDAGEKLFGVKEVEAATADPSAKEKLDALNTQAAHAIGDYIEAQKLGITGLFVLFDGTAGKVTLQGEAPTQQAFEKAALAAGNVASVKEVENLLTVATPEPEAQYHDVVRGDTLSAIALKYYGNAGKYPVIFEANKPMLSDPDKIYPGQKLRIPPLA
ncbi:MAG TPA: peptidoglycan-binding protein LysM [Burkholderiaceae bacterium]